jgi:hypothetical protein
MRSIMYHSPGAAPGILQSYFETRLSLKIVVDRENIFAAFSSHCSTNVRPPQTPVKTSDVLNRAQLFYPQPYYGRSCALLSPAHRLPYMVTRKAPAHAATSVNSPRAPSFQAPTPSDQNPETILALGQSAEWEHNGVCHHWCTRAGRH